MMKWSVTLCAVLVGLVSIAGCSAPYAVNESEAVPRRAQPLVTKHITYAGNSSLADTVVLERVVSDPRQTPMQVQFELRNTDGSPVDFQYKILWFNSSGMELHDSAQVWIKRTIEGNERMQLQSVGVSPSAVDFRLVVQRWDR